MPVLAFIISSSSGEKRQIVAETINYGVKSNTGKNISEHAMTLLPDEFEVRECDNTYSNGLQKIFYLPEAHTDFIFAILIEELGILGGLLLIVLYLFLIIGVFKVSFESFNKIRPFQGYLCFGIGFLISLQVILNIGVNIGLLPTKGLTLPFISYGGSSMLAFTILFAGYIKKDLVKEKFSKRFANLSEKF